MTAPRIRTALPWLAAVGIAELTTRVVVYALAPPAAQLSELRGDLGGPRPLVVAAVAVTLALTLSAGVLALAALGARERWALSDPDVRGEAPRLRLSAVLRLWLTLWGASLIVFVAVESYIHMRAGLGFHGLSCLTGPVHINAIPVAAAVSLFAAASATAAQHLFAWMRRVVERLLGSRRRRRTAPPRLPRPRHALAPHHRAVPAPLMARPPPALLRV